MKGGRISRERWGMLEPLLDAALELEPEQRHAFADEACARDAALCAELKALLLACEKGDDFLATPATVAFAPLLVESGTAMPARLGRYALVREIGRGGMATVYLADDPKHGRQVAVKVLHAQLARLIGRERFLREIEIAAGLSHPHILPLHDSGEAHEDRPALGGGESILYFVSPFVSGESLRDLLQRERRMPVEGVVRLGREVAMALDYAHRQGVIHLDIKPANILLQEGHAIIADFGIARAMSNAGDERTAGAAALMGTPSYMSPEQAAGAPDIDGRSDVYSLGCVLYEMITGERPFVREANTAMVPAQVAVPRDPSVLSAHAPPELAAAIVRAMSAARADRFATAGELARALSDSVLEKGTRRVHHRRRVFAGALVVVVAIASLVAARGARVSLTMAQDAPAIISEKSIAVLPFVNMSPDKEQVYFSDGLTEDLSSLLAKRTDLRVASHTFGFRNEQIDPKDVARQLRVAYLLRGTVQTSDTAIRVTAQLIKGADGTTVWSESYDRKLTDLFAIQDEIADRAVKALKTTLLADALTANIKPHNAASYNHVLRGRYFLTQVTQASVARAVDCFRDALLDDPKNAVASAWLARAYEVQAGNGWMPVAEGSALAREAARNAIAIDPQLADGYEALAYIQSAYDWDWDAAETSYRRALDLDPRNADVLRSAALLMAKLGRYDEAIIGLRKAIDRDPTARTYSNLSYVLGASGRWDEAEAAARTALALGPNSVLRHFNLARALLFQGKNGAALREVEQERGESWRLMGQAIVYHAVHRDAESDRALAEYEERFATHSALQIADVHAYRGDIGVAFMWLDRAYAQHDPGIADIRNDPWLGRIRGDARYTALLRKMRLAR